MVTARPSDFNSHAKSMSYWLLLVITNVFCRRSLMSNCHITLHSSFILQISHGNITQILTGAEVNTDKLFPEVV